MFIFDLRKIKWICFKMSREKGGPLSVLARCILSGQRIRVHIRGINKIRGFAVGTLVSERLKYPIFTLRHVHFHPYFVLHLCIRCLCGLYSDNGSIL
jgi:hypothetical protein